METTGFTSINGALSCSNSFYNDGTTTTTTTTTTGYLIDQGEITIDKFEFKETSDGNFIEITKRQKPNPNYTLAIWPPAQQTDRVWKEIYGITGDNNKKELKLIKKIEGKVMRGHYVDEEVIFE